VAGLAKAEGGPFALKISIVRISSKANDDPDVIDSITLTRDSYGRPYRNQLKLLMDAGFWVKSKKIELQNRGLDPRDFRILVTEVAGYRKPQWLFDRIKKIMGVTVV